MDVMALPMKLTTRQVAKPWGRADIPAPFTNTGPDRIGEIWFEAEDAAPLALMVKYIFTSEKLSIQVHPGHAYARTIGLSGGKEECWLVLDAEPGATLGIGLVRDLSGDELRAAALDGSIEQLLAWHPVARGDFFYIPAGTIHAIGAGLSLIEIQQNADVTFRLYDYGRPRELHLDQSIAVANAAPYRHTLARHIDLDTDQTLVDGPLFGLRLAGDAPQTLEGTGPLLVIPIEGSVSVQTAAGAVTAAAGECLAVDPASSYHASNGARLLLARAHENGQTA
ncbi:mannose-6-phosphate isomerase [Blastomonas sp. AAP25]|nr:mannose-6-phosphate isomerase [Blastomonas sp. AAP25]